EVPSLQTWPSSIRIPPFRQAESSEDAPVKQAILAGGAAYSSMQTGLSASRRNASRQPNVIDQTRLPEIYRQQQHRVRSNRIHWLQHFCVGDLYVIDSCQVRFIDDHLRERDDIAGSFFAGIFGREQRFAQDRGLLSFFGVQILVARTACQAVFFPDSGHCDDVDLEIEIAPHPANNRQLLKIFLAEPRRISRENVEQLRDHCAHSAEMSGTRFAFQRCRQRSLFPKRRSVACMESSAGRTK